MAHPSLLTADRQEKILEALRTGATVKSAAHYSGISEVTLYDWRTRGRHYRAFLESQDGGGDQLAERLWRDAAELFNSGDRQAAFAALADLDSRLDRSDERKYLELDTAIARTIAEVKIRLTGTVVRAAFAGDWKAAMAILRARWPDEYAERRIVTVEPETENEIERRHAALRGLLDLERARRTASSNGSG